MTSPEAAAEAMGGDRGEQRSALPDVDRSWRSGWRAAISSAGCAGAVDARRQVVGRMTSPEAAEAMGGHRGEQRSAPPDLY